MEDLIIYVCLPIAILVLTWMVGRALERRHLKSLAERERATEDIILMTVKHPCGAVSKRCVPQLICGEAVISSDYFKTWLFGLRNLVGGESRTFTRLYDRARREATLRLKEAARAQGCNAICNIHYDGTDIGGNTSGNGNSSMKMAVCLVSGTAYQIEEWA